MNWKAMEAEDKKLYNLLEQASAAAEEGMGRMLAASACLDILRSAFRYDRCRELMEVMVDYGRRKVAEEEEHPCAKA